MVLEPSMLRLRVTKTTEAKSHGDFENGKRAEFMEEGCRWTEKRKEQSHEAEDQ